VLFVKEIFNAGIGVDETISYYTPIKLLKKGVVSNEQL